MYKKIIYLSVSLFIASLTYLSILAINLNKENEIINKIYFPSLEKLHHVQLSHSMAHLWFEEFLSGDASENIDEIKTKYTVISKQILLTKESLLALHNPQVMKEYYELVASHKRLLELVDLRNSELSEAGTISDALFDKVFKELLNYSDILISNIESKLNLSIVSINKNKNQLFIFILFSLVLAIFIAYKYTQLQISYKKKLQEAVKKKTHELELSRNKAQKADMAKSEFLANMSHEIRTPMNAIVGFAELLAKKDIDVDTKIYVDTILGSSNALLVIINDILDLSKIEANKLEINPEPSSFEEILKEVDSIFELKVKQKRIQFKFSVDKTLPNSLYIDPIRIRQIFINLIGNSVKFTPEFGDIHV